jgi:hypothetical protein
MTLFLDYAKKINNTKEETLTPSVSAVSGLNNNCRDNNIASCMSDNSDVIFAIASGSDITAQLYKVAGKPR